MVSTTFAVGLGCAFFFLGATSAPSYDSPTVTRTSMPSGVSALDSADSTVSAPNSVATFLAASRWPSAYETMVSGTPNDSALPPETAS